MNLAQVQVDEFLRRLALLISGGGTDMTILTLTADPTLTATLSQDGQMGNFAGEKFLHLDGGNNTNWVNLTKLAGAMIEVSAAADPRSAGHDGHAVTFSNDVWLHGSPKSFTDLNWVSVSQLAVALQVLNANDVPYNYTGLATLLADTANILTAADDALRSWWIEYSVADFQAHPVTGSQSVIDVPALPVGSQIMSARLVVDPVFACSDVVWNGSLSLGDVGLPARLCSLRADGADGASGDMASGNPRVQDPAAIKLMLNLTGGGTLANLTGGTVMVQIRYTVH